MLELRNITKIYNPGEVTESCLFRDFSLTVQQGEFVSIVGSNGSGKTSLLNIICGSTGVQSGDILIDGASMLHQKEYIRYRRFGRVYQNPALGTSPNLTMYENLSLADNKGGRYNLTHGTSRTRREYYREQLAALGLGLEDKMDVKMGALSGGQRQAVALLMATMTPIDFLILDEHTAALDPATAEKVLELTKSIVAQNRITCLMITHDISSALQLGNRTIIMNAGKIVGELDGPERANMDEGQLLEVFRRFRLNDDRLLFRETP